MFKGAKLFSMLLLFLLFTIGCSSREEVTVSTYDEKIEELEKDRLTELKDNLFEQYSDDLGKMKDDLNYDEYVRLNGRYSMGNTESSEAIRSRFSGRVNLDTQTVKHLETTVKYEYTADGIEISNNDSELLDETYVRMVGLAENKVEELKDSNRRLILTAGWMPILTLIIGIFAWIKPESVWYLEGGFRNKEAEPSDAALKLIRFQAIIAFSLTVFLIWLFINQLA